MRCGVLQGFFYRVRCKFADFPWEAMAEGTMRQLPHQLSAEQATFAWECVRSHWQSNKSSKVASPKISSVLWL